MRIFLNWVKDTAERAGATFVVTILPLLFNGTALNLDLATQAGIAGIAATFSALKGAVFPDLGIQNRVLDVMSRAGWSAFQAGIAVLSAVGLGWVDLSVWHGAGLAALAAAGSVVKGALAERFGSPDSVTPASVVRPVEARRAA